MLQASAQISILDQLEAFVAFTPNFYKKSINLKASEGSKYSRESQSESASNLKQKSHLSEPLAHLLPCSIADEEQFRHQLI